MEYYLSVPSKTFLLGEYAAVKGGPALVLTTNPRFQLKATFSPEKNNRELFHAESPAGKFFYQNSSNFESLHLEFSDPYNGLGGFGASSAQFILLAALKNTINPSTFDDNNLLKEYQNHAWDGQGLPPSGADLIAQVHGKLCYFHKAQKKLQTFSWPFADLGYALIHTGNKLATHEHLKNRIHFETAPLIEIAQRGFASLCRQHSQHFVQAVNDYGKALKSQNLVAEPTQKMIQDLLNHSDILAAKGCGAMGADVLFCLFEKKKQEEVIPWLKKKYHLITFGQELAFGLECSKRQRNGE